MPLNFLSKLPTDVVIGVQTRFGTELESTTDDVVPVALAEVSKVVTTNTILDEAIEDTRVEVVACANCAHRSNRLNGIALGEFTTVELHSLGATAIDEAGAIEVDLLLEHTASLADTVEHLEVFVGTTHNIGILEVLDDSTHQFDCLTGMIAAEVDIVVDDGTRTASLIEQCGHLISHVGIEGIVGAKKHDVIALYLRTLPVGTPTERLLVEGVGGVVIRIEEGQGDGRLAVGILGKETVIDSIVGEEGTDDTTYLIVAYLIWAHGQWLGCL